MEQGKRHIANIYNDKADMKADMAPLEPWVLPG